MGMPGRSVARIPFASFPRPRLRIAVIYGVIFLDLSCIVEIEEKNVAMCSETG